MEAKKLHRVTVEEYLEIERSGDVRYEFHDGHIYAMAGGSFNHGLISGNIFSELNVALRANESSCFPLNNDIKLHVRSENRFLYPDAMVICEDVERSESDKEAVTNPKVIIEVLSKTTESYDRGDKFYFYRQIENLQEYILIDQNRPQIDVYNRSDSGLWKILRITGLENKLQLHSLNLEIDLQSIYRNVVFEE